MYLIITIIVYERVNNPSGHYGPIRIIEDNYVLAELDICIYIYIYLYLHKYINKYISIHCVCMCNLKFVPITYTINISE